MVIDQDKRTDRHWVIVTLLGWGLISALLFVRQWRLWGLFEVSLMIAVALIAGFLLTFIVVSLPFRVWQNVTQPERRRTRIRETVLCILTFLALVNLVYSLIVSYPPDW
jgi:phosphatidylserine synthase